MWPVWSYYVAANVPFNVYSPRHAQIKITFLLTTEYCASQDYNTDNIGTISGKAGMVHSVIG